MSREGTGDGTVGKALQVLDRVAEFGRPVRFSELVENSEFPKATLYRLVQTLTGQGMLTWDPDHQTYSLGLRLVRLAHAAWQQASLAPIARPHIDALADEIQETVHLAQLDHSQVLYVDKRTPKDAIRMFSSAGKVGPAYCTGVGKALLAWLDETQLDAALEQQSFHRFTPKTLTDAGALRKELSQIRARGYAFDDEEHEPGIICIAFPVFGSPGEAIAALSVTSSTARRTLDNLNLLTPRVRRAAEAIASDMRYWRFPDRPEKTKRTGT